MSLLPGIFILNRWNRGSPFAKHNHDNTNRPQVYKRRQVIDDIQSSWRKKTECAKIHSLFQHPFISAFVLDNSIEAKMAQAEADKNAGALMALVERKRKLDDMRKKLLK